VLWSTPFPFHLPPFPHNLSLHDLRFATRLTLSSDPHCFHFNCSISPGIRPVHLVQLYQHSSLLKVSLVFWFLWRLRNISELGQGLFFKRKKRPPNTPLWIPVHGKATPNSLSESKETRKWLIRDAASLPQGMKGGTVVLCSEPPHSHTFGGSIDSPSLPVMQWKQAWGK